MQPEIRTVAAKAWPWRTLQIRGLCPKRAEGRARVSSRHGQQFVTTHLKMRRVARPDGVAPRTAHPPSSLCRVLPPMRLFWRASRWINLPRALLHMVTLGLRAPSAQFLVDFSPFFHFNGRNCRSFSPCEPLLEPQIIKLS